MHPQKSSLKSSLSYFGSFKPNPSQGDGWNLLKIPKGGRDDIKLNLT